MDFTTLAAAIRGTIIQFRKDSEINYLITDSRKAPIVQGALFAAIRGDRHNGHDHLHELYERGVRSFLIEESKGLSLDLVPEANVVLVVSTLQALQLLAALKRKTFRNPVIGITGSNGKTIVKEWLFELTSPDKPVLANPGSYNSQLGVALSVWNLLPEHKLAIFEAGISTTGEMQRLRAMINPTVGIITNLGSAHDQGFEDRKQKLEEKLSLFNTCERVIYCSDHELIKKSISDSKLPGLSWGISTDADIRIEKKEGVYHATFKNAHSTFILPFDDAASVENCFHCIATMFYLGYPVDQIQKRVLTLRSIPKRLELKEGVNNCQLIDDSYNNDLAGLQLSLQFLVHQKQRTKKTVILSDIHQSGLSPEMLCAQVADLLKSNAIDRFFGIGPVLSSQKKQFAATARFFETTDEFLRENPSSFQNELILIKGARTFEFERIVAHLQKRMHGTVLEVNLDTLVENLNFFKSKIRSDTRLMVMVKALAYGSGSIEIANLLRYHKVDYLGVAYADEGIDLRNNHVDLPIMVMNPTVQSLESIFAYNLEPEVYSLELMRAVISQSRGNPVRIHIKLDTGMSRLGLVEKDLSELMDLLRQYPNVGVASIFSHLAGSDEEVYDAFSHQQAALFTRLADRVDASLTNKPLRHLLNSAGILRFPEYQFNMVRLGIGLYGIGSDGLKPVTRLKSTISQIHKIMKGASVGYGRAYHAANDREIATIAIGYADGFSRAFSNGIGSVLVNGRRAPVVGRVCMDMTMIDVTGLEAKEGDDVILFGDSLPIEEVAASIHTIPYEILTNTSSRVSRVFVSAGI